MEPECAFHHQLLRHQRAERDRRPRRRRRPARRRRRAARRGARSSAPAPLPEHSNTASKRPLSTMSPSSAFGSARRFTARSAPSRRTRASGASTRSVATTSRAPACRTASTQRAPIGPEPLTSTRAPEHRPGLAHRVQADRQRLGQGRLPEGQRRRDLDGLGFVTKPALGGTRPAHGASAWRCRRTACPGTGSAGRPGRRRSAPQGWLGLIATWSPTCRCRTPSPSASTSPATLVPQDHRLAQPHGAEAALLVVMQVRAADAAGADADLHLAGPGRFGRDRLDAQVAGGVDDDSLHSGTF